MRDANRRVGLVHVLSARARRAVGIDAQVRGIQIDGLDRLELREDRDRARRSVNASLRLGRRHALHAVGARLELQQRVGAATDDAADDFLVAAVLAGTLGEHLHLPALRFGVTGIHAKQIAREQRGLVAAGACAHLQKNIAVVVWILRHEQALQRLFFHIDAAAELLQLILHREFTGGREVPLEGEKSAIAIDHGTQAGVLHGKIPELVLAPDDIGLGQEAADLLVALVELFQLASDRILHAANYSGLSRGSGRVLRKAGA